MAGARRDQRDRDRLRSQPVGFIGRRGRMDAVLAVDLEALGRRRQRRRCCRPVQPGRRDLHRRPLPARRRRLDESVASDLRLQPRRLVRPVSPPAREADRRNPVPADRRADRPRPGPLPGRGAGQVRRRFCPAASQGAHAWLQRRRPDQHRSVEHRDLDLRQDRLAGDRRQRREDPQGRRQREARPLHPAPGCDRQRLHVLAARFGLEQVPGAQARQAQPERSRQGARGSGR